MGVAGMIPPSKEGSKMTSKIAAVTSGHFELFLLYNGGNDRNRFAAVKEGPDGMRVSYSFFSADCAMEAKELFIRKVEATILDFEDAMLEVLRKDAKTFSEYKRVLGESKFKKYFGVWRAKRG